MSKFEKKLSAQIWNINIPINKGITSPFSVATTEIKAVENNLITLLNTQVGERVMSDYGCNLKRYLFEPNDRKNADLILKDIKNASNRWLPYLTIINFQINKIDNEIGSLEYQCNYKLKNENYIREINEILSI